MSLVGGQCRSLTCPGRLRTPLPLEAESPWRGGSPGGWHRPFQSVEKLLLDEIGLCDTQTPVGGSAAGALLWVGLEKAGQFPGARRSRWTVRNRRVPLCGQVTKPGHLAEQSRPGELGYSLKQHSFIRTSCRGLGSKRGQRQHETWTVAVLSQRAVLGKLCSDHVVNIREQPWHFRLRIGFNWVTFVDQLLPSGYGSP